MEKVKLKKACMLLLPMFIFSSCSSGPGFRRHIGIPFTYHLLTEEKAQVFYRPINEVPKELLMKNNNELTGIEWGCKDKWDKKFLEEMNNDPNVCNGLPLKKEKLVDSRYSERWVYPYAYVYFKREKVAYVEFRGDEIKKLTGLVRTHIEPMYT